MQHWKEPAPLGEAQRIGYTKNSVMAMPAASASRSPSMSAYMAPIDLPPVVNSPGPTSGGGLAGRVGDFATSAGGSTVTLLLGLAVGYYLGKNYELFAARPAAEEL